MEIQGCPPIYLTVLHILPASGTTLYTPAMHAVKHSITFAEREYLKVKIPLRIPCISGYY